MVFDKKRLQIFSTSILTIILLMVCLSVAVSEAGGISRTSSVYAFEEIASQIDIEAIEDHVNIFSGFGSRVTGYPGSYEAADYIYGKFGEYGLTDVNFHYYNVTVPIDQGARLRILSPINKDVTIYPLWPNVAALVKTPPGGINGDLVYVGDGSTFDGIPIEGNIALMDFNSWQNWLEAAKLGAKAVILIEPGDTTWYQTKLKVIDLAFSFPRLYIKDEDAQPLLNLLQEGEVAVNLESNMYFETVEAPNILGYVRGTIYPELYVIVSAHYDSFSYVPSVAPGADSAIGVSVLLEMAKFYAKNPPKFTILFIAYSGTYQGLVGSRAFISEKVLQDWDNIGQKIVMQLHIDLSAESPDVGISNSGMFFHMHAGLGKGREKIIQHYIPDLIAGIEPEISPHKVDRRGFSLELIGVTAGAVWYFTAGLLPTCFDSEPLVLIGGTGIAIYTPAVSRNLWGTVVDTPERMNFENLENQLKFAHTFIYNILNEETLRSDLVPEWTPTFCQPYGPKWTEVIGAIAEYNDTTGWYEPVPEALVLDRPGTTLGPNFMDVAQLWTYSFADQEGRIALHGCTESNMIGPWMIRAYVIDSETGEVIYASDQGERAYGGLAEGGAGAIYGSFSIFKNPMDFGVITIFKSAHMVMFDLGNPYYHNQALDNSVNVLFNDLRSHYAPIHRSAEQVVFSGTGESIAILHVPVDTPIEILMRASDAMRRPLGILSNASEAAPYGAGYTMTRPGEQYTITNTALHFAESFYWLNEARLRELIGLSIGVEPARVIHEQTKLGIEDAEAAFQFHQYSAFQLSAASAWRYERDAYVNLKNDIEDAINTIPFFGVLLVPFALIAERAMSATVGRRRLISILLCYLVPSIILWFLHPGFRLSQDSMMVLSGFAILVLSMPLIGIIGGLLIEALKHLRKEVMGLHFAEMARTDAVLVAFAHGIEQMRKRRMRTFLMIFSIIVVTVGVTLFMSSSTLTATRLMIGPIEPSYEGILVRPAQWGRAFPRPWPRFPSGNNLGDVVYGLTGTILGPDDTLAPRSWLYMYTAQMSLKVSRGDKEMAGYAVLGLSPEEAEVTGIDKLLVDGRWFIDSDVRTVIVTTAQAERLGITSVPEYINVMGMTMTVVGILDSEAANSFRDLDGEAITPLEYRAPAATYDVHMDVNDVIIVPYTLSKSIGAWTISIAMKLGNSANLQNMAAGLFDLFQIPVIVGMGGQQIIFSKAMFIVLFGWQYQLIPLAMAILLMANLALGSIQERKGEINILGSLGLSPLHVGSLFLAESVTFAVLGGLTGYLSGLFVSVFARAQIGMLINFSSTWVVTAVGIVMLAVVLSTIYPSILSSRLVTPSLVRAWKPGRPVGDSWETPLPFVVSDDSEARGVMAYLYEFFASRDSFEAPIFWTRRIQLSQSEQAGVIERVISMDTSLAPYETGVNQATSFISAKLPGERRYSFRVVINRTGGEREYWQIRNATFLDLIRKQILLWRSLEAEERSVYFDRYKELR